MSEGEAVNERNRGDGPIERPAKLNELTAMQLSVFERQYDEDDRSGFEMSAETCEWSPVEAEAVWRWIGDARNDGWRRP